uniref:Uncharacterized protein n=1 Tax=Fagus sylvatica TaxID=28930 RepID=A0A2N9IHY2_FAGSY
MVEGLKAEAGAAGGAVEADWRRSKREAGGDQNRGETERGGLVQSCKEQIRPEQAEMGRNGRNGPEYEPRWNRGVTRTGLHTGTRFSVRSGLNGTDYTTLVKTSIISRCAHGINRNFDLPQT